MAVAHQKYFSKENIEANKFNASPELAEQAVHCLELVSELVDAGLQYQFKGGNSLLIILNTAKRFSIDVDIATNTSVEEIEKILDLLPEKYGVFTEWKKRQHKTKPWLPISSYYLFYRSQFTDSQKTSIMLDVQLKESPYQTELKQVTCGELYISTSKATLPLPASIIGDKLLTIGPCTLGIPLKKGKEAQRLKHVYDVSTLLKTTPDLDEIRDSFSACMEQENKIQKNGYNSRAVMLDTIKFCGSVTAHHEQPDHIETLPDMLKENVVGLHPFAEHLFESNYDWKKMQIDMARAALCITAVCLVTVPHEEFRQALEQPESISESPLLPQETLPENSEARRYWNQISSWLGRNPLGE